MIYLTVSRVIPNSPFYQQLKDKINKKVLHLQDSRGTFLLDKLHEKNLKYFVNNVLDRHWNNPLLLVMMVQVFNNIDAQTIYTISRVLHPRMKDLFNAFSLKSMTAFDVEVHLYQYLKGDVFSEHSNSMRANLLKEYRIAAYATKKWITQKIEVEKQSYFEQFLLPIPSFDMGDFSFNKLARSKRHNNRKSETDAVVPSLPEIRAEGHFRMNQMKRIRDNFLLACEQANSPDVGLPLEFSWEEPERIGEHFYFRLWDKPSFVLHHREQFSTSVIKKAAQRSGVYSAENNHYFVEFIKAERIEDDDMAEGPWFIELFEKGVVGYWSYKVTDEEAEQKRELLNSWGYREGNSTVNPIPFFLGHNGMLSPGNFVSRNQDKANGVLFDVEPAYVTATFGLLALDIFTTTGARMNELLQLNNDKGCLKAGKFKNKIRYSFYAVPKGRDEAEPFYISEQTVRLIREVQMMLKEHYESEGIPSVEYRDARKHLFPDPKKYFFQYNHKAFKDITVSACVRFLVHGLRFETQEGKPVAVKSHLLRHAFATEAVQRQDMSINVVAKILHQNDVKITEYYSEPTPSQIAQSISDLHDMISDYIDIDETYLRSPKKLQEELDEYQEKVGVFNNVLGGTCVTDMVCTIKMACLGCQAKIPEPEKKHELVEVIDLSKDMEKRYDALGLTVEVKKARAMRRHARNELKEIELIEQYREEQNYESKIQFNK
ncbi:site-specific integrase [Bacillus thuringiensis]|uniref:Site-specific integrase n=1 Tax=Bacillus thuringiensis TaxID=1428 RepID=A0A437SBE6_BACTU|nr:tyrosine-type recombinase/integrase [Bacillus thuringiensis]RVU60397.1 site-specific integrase [Bacillus thuringiensis]